MRDYQWLLKHPVWFWKGECYYKTKPKPIKLAMCQYLDAILGRQEKMWTWTRSIESRCCPHIQQWLHCPPPPGSLTKVEMSENWWNLLTYSIWIKFYQENIVHIRLRICKWTETGWECQYFRHLKCSYCTQNCAGNLGWEMPPGLNSEKQLKTECIWITMPECPCQYSQPKCSHVHSLLRTLRNEYQTKVKAKAALETWFQLLYQTVSNIFSSQNDRESQKLWPCLRFDRFLVAGDVTPEADMVDTGYALSCQQTAQEHILALVPPIDNILTMFLLPHSHNGSSLDHH